jgi:hypothetical protein
MTNWDPPDPPDYEEDETLSPDYADPRVWSEVEAEADTVWWAERETFEVRYPGVRFPTRLLLCPKSYRDPAEKRPRGMTRCGRPWQHAGPCGPDRRKRPR